MPPSVLSCSAVLLPWPNLVELLGWRKVHDKRGRNPAPWVTCALGESASALPILAASECAEVSGYPCMIRFLRVDPAVGSVGFFFNLV